MEDKLLTGGEWVANGAHFEGVRRPFAHTSPYLTRLPRYNSSGAVHVVGMSDTSVDLDPFEMWDEVELSARTGFHVRKIQRWRKDGGGPPFILQGKKPRYRAVAVLKWLEACESASERLGP
ncbi:helix-turn-helix domain-containing protein [Microbacterium hominis]|uniref:helix-turn-helix transcriptional regulator n=1 Tax=Microbacterium hominis TaxID=162426 RepID=UPI0019667948|nr:helix-turn-helix domain-containing protein [Microbacterium hominis]QRY40452.1 helix-turn-helix domain-containing protein [Microbacterium hominis]